MWKILANMLLGALAIGLMFFTASRTLDLLAQWLPVNQQIMQYLGLAAFEGGLYFWAFYFVVAAKGQIQRALAFLMIVICFVSVAVATVTDLLLVGAQDGRLPAIPATQQQALVIFVGLVIVANVAAFLAAKLSHPDKLREMAVQDANDQIIAMELEMIRRMAPTVAMQMAPVKVDQWVNETWESMLPGARPRQAPQQIEAQAVEALPVTPVSLAQTAPQLANSKPGILSKVAHVVAGMWSEPKESVALSQTDERALPQQPVIEATRKPVRRVQSTQPKQISPVAETRRARRLERYKRVPNIPPAQPTQQLFHQAPNQEGNGAQ